MKLVELKVIMIVEDDNDPKKWVAGAISENLHYHNGETVASVVVISENEYVRETI
jgi:hypothetical protein